MSRIFICLLLILVIALSCFVLVACTQQVNGGAASDGSTEGDVTEGNSTEGGAGGTGKPCRHHFVNGYCVFCGQPE